MKTPLADIENGALIAAQGIVAQNLRAALGEGDADKTPALARAGLLIAWEMRGRSLIDDATFAAISECTLASGACAS